MIALSLITRNAKVVRSGLERLRRAIPSISRKRMYDAALRARRKIVAEPPRRRGQRYVRTGTYKRGLKVVPYNDGVSFGYTLKGQAVDRRGHDYTKYVGGDAEGQGQAWMHRRRWTLARGAMQEEELSLPRSIQDEIDVVARGSVASSI